MTKFEASTLEEAISTAATALGCSVLDLDYTITQNESKGFLGFFKKNAIIVAQCKNLPSSESKIPLVTIRNEGGGERYEKVKKSVPTYQPKNEPRPLVEVETKEKVVNTEKVEHTLNEMQREASIDNFYREKIEIDSILDDIACNLNTMFSFTCYHIEPIEVVKYDDTTVLIKFNGDDAALLIGKDGYRYKALSYMLFNWINGVYGFGLRLEIAEFLHNQEEMIQHYLEPVKEAIRSNGKAQTKVLDGILIQIALKELRDTFPDKYIGVKENSEGGRYIIIGPFLRRE